MSKKTCHISKNYGRIAATTSRIREGSPLCEQKEVTTDTNEKSQIIFGDDWSGNVATAISVAKKDFILP